MLNGSYDPDKSGFPDLSPTRTHRDEDASLSGDVVAYRITISSRHPNPRCTIF